MKVRLAYGKSGLDVQLPDGLHIDIITPRHPEPAPDPAAAVRDALQKPIGCDAIANQVKPRDKVAIVFNDITRATPYDILMPVLLEELSHVPPENITLFNATGTHRQNTDAELRSMLGNACVDRYKIIQNNAEDTDSHVTVGTTQSGNEIRVLKDYRECDFRILTGFIEPHFFAGFSGGPKACVPGLADLDTVLRNHSVEHIDAPQACWAKTAGNPIWDELSEAVDLTGQAFLLNVAMNPNKQITGVFAGDIKEAHRTGCDFVRKNSMAAVAEPYDIVISSNSGYPLDLNMYQSVKGMSAAARIVKSGGIIIIASDCWDGFPDHGLYKKLLTESESPEALLKRIHKPEYSSRDTWQAQIHAQICRKAKVYFFSDHLTDEQIRSAFMLPCRDISELVQLLTRQSEIPQKICVLPDGPLTIPYLRP